MIGQAYLGIFAASFLGCVLATPLVIRLAGWLGAIDRPDTFRRIHKSATPRMGGLAVAFGIGLGLCVVALSKSLEAEAFWLIGVPRLTTLGLASLVILSVGAIDDTRGLQARTKLFGQIAAVLVLYLGGIRIDQIELLGWVVELDQPALAIPWGSWTITLAPWSFGLTLFWFLGCMNVWNLIDGLDGLASGVGLLVTGTLMLVALNQNNLEAAVLAAALVGSLAGFLLYNWHPACVFLGDTGSLLIGLWIGVIGVQGSIKGASAVAILLPILAMGLPISDTAMAIFRRWVRQLPLSAVDRRHVHHLLIGLGLNPRQAAALLYCFSGFLCGVVLIGEVLNNEGLALVLGISGASAFLLILTSRRDELDQLARDLRERFRRGGQQRVAAEVCWEAIQRIELQKTPDEVVAVFREAAVRLGWTVLDLQCRRDGQRIRINLDRDAEPDAESRSNLSIEEGPEPPDLSGPLVRFRLTEGTPVLLSCALKWTGSPTSGPSMPDLETDIAFRFVQRLARSTVKRIADQTELALTAHTEGLDQPIKTASTSNDPVTTSQLVVGRPSRPLAAVVGSESEVQSSRSREG